MEPPLRKTLPAEAAPQPGCWMGTHSPPKGTPLCGAGPRPRLPTLLLALALRQSDGSRLPGPAVNRDSGGPSQAASPAGAHMHTQTHPHVLGIVCQAPQPFDDSVPVLLPLPLAEHNLQEVPRPADEGHEQQLPLGQDFGALEGGGAQVVRCRPRGPPGCPRTGPVSGW